jgi:hypothetical protein
MLCLLRNHSSLLAAREPLQGSPLCLQNRLHTNSDRTFFILDRLTNLLDASTEAFRHAPHCVKRRRIYPRKE